MSEALKPCPFCGGEAVVINLPGSVSYKVSCNNCGAPGHKASVPLTITKDQAIEAWNKRVSEQSTELGDSPGKKFLKDLDALCTRHGVVIDHEDSQGGFLLRDLNKTDMEHLLAAEDLTVPLSTPKSILEELQQAHEHGQKKYGGEDPDSHDQDHMVDEWLKFIDSYLTQVSPTPTKTLSPSERHCLVKAGGLILSALLATDANRRKR